MYAIIEAGGKQLKVAPGEIVEVEKIEAEVGDKIIFEHVLLVKEDGKDPQVGRPHVANTVVETEVLGQGKAKKIDVYSFNNKGTQRRIGHRQPFTSVKVLRIGAN